MTSRLFALALATRRLRLRVRVRQHRGSLLPLPGFGTDQAARATMTLFFLYPFIHSFGWILMNIHP